jgi:hypothetical protein
VFLNNINYIIEYISYFNFFKLKYKGVNKEFVLYLDFLVIKKGGRTIYK